MKSTTILVLLITISAGSSASRLPTRRVASPTHNSADVPAQAPTPKTLNSARKVGPPTSLQQREIPVASMNEPVPVSVRPKIMSPPVSTEPLPVEPIVMLSVPRPKPRQQASVSAITKQEFVPEEAQEVVSQPIDTDEENQPQPEENQTPSDDAVEQVTAFEVSTQDEATEVVEIFEPEIIGESTANEQPLEITEETVAGEQQPRESSPNPETVVFEESEEEAALVVEVIHESDSEEETLEQPPEDESKSLEVIETEEEVVGALADNESQPIAVIEEVNVDLIEMMISEKNNGESPANEQPAADGSDESDLVISDKEEVDVAPVEDESQLIAVTEDDDLVESTILEESAEESPPNEQPLADDSETTDLAISDEEEIIKEVIIESSIEEDFSVEGVEDESKSLETVDGAQEDVVQQPLPYEKMTTSNFNSVPVQVATEPGTSPTCVMPEDGSPPSCDFAQAAGAFESEGDILSQAIIDLSES